MTAVSPLPGSYCQVMYAASDNEYSDEAMEEVNLSTLPYGAKARHTVYKISDTDKATMHDNEVPVFQYQDGGVGEWATLTPSEIWYEVGYIILSTPLESDDVVRCHTGHYLTLNQLFGCASRGPTNKTTTQECTCYGDTAIKRWPLQDDWSDKLDVFYAAMQAELQTTGGATNSHLLVRHIAGGTDGNDVSLEMENPGGDGSLSISVSVAAITVTLARASDVITSTAIDVIQALNQDLDVQALNVRAEVPSGEDGSGLVAVLSHTHLAGGKDPIDFTALKGSDVVMRYYDNYEEGVMWCGKALLEQIDWSGDPGNWVKCSLSVSGNSPLRQVT